jgi:ribosomal protein S18 acetylase RimI-like enzyme
MVRPAAKSDIGAVREVVHAAYRHYVARIGKPPGPMLDDYAQRIANGQTWLLESGDCIVAILVLEEAPTGLLLDNIAVLPECQGKGYGRTLMEFAEAEALRRGFREISLYTHALMSENIALYRRVGFAETHRINEKGYDRVYMTKPLRG